MVHQSVALQLQFRNLTSPDDMQKKIDTVSKALATKRNKLSDLEQQIATDKEELPEAEARVQELQGDLDVAASKLEEMQGALQGEVGLSILPRSELAHCEHSTTLCGDRCPSSA
jgi:septal ring factor EnvC (AmiA/AmiB activator)